MVYKRVYQIVCLFAALSLGGLRGANITWTNTSGGLWSVPVNWSSHTLPGPSDAALITSAGTYTVTVDTNVAVFGLTLGGASGLQTLTNHNQIMGITNALVAANGIFQLGSSGTVNGLRGTNQGTINLSGGTINLPLTVSPAGIVNLNGSGVALEGALTNNGTINMSGPSSTLTLYNNRGIFTGSFYNQAGALFDIQNDQSVYSAGYGFESFTNNGTVRKSAGVGTTYFYVPFTNANTGTVDAQSGTIAFQNGGNIAGTYNTASNTTIQFGGGGFTETGPVTNTGSGLFRQYGATVTLNDRIPRFFLANGNVVLSPTFQGSGAIQDLQLDGATLTGTNRVTGTLGIDGGAVGQASPLTVTTNGVLDFNGGLVLIYAPITNFGTIYWSGSSLSLGNNTNTLTGAIYNRPGGVFDLQNDQGVTSQGYGFEHFDNAGTVVKTAGIGISSFAVVFTNTGTVDAESGTIQFTAGGNIGGTYNTASGGRIQFASGNYFENGPVTIAGSGLCQVSGATVTLNDQISNLVLSSGNVVLSPTFQNNGAISNLQLHGATLIGTNRVSGTLGLDGGALGSSVATSPLTILPGGVLDFNGAAVTINAPLTNNGTINWNSGNLTLANNGSSLTGVLYNQPAGHFNLLCDQSLSYSVGLGLEFFSNAGTVRKTAGVGTTAISVNSVNTGLIDAQSGAIHFSGGGTIGGTNNTASGATIAFDSGNYTAGTTTITGAGQCRLNGATVTLNDRIANFLLASGNVLLTPTFQTNGPIQNLQLDGATLLGTNRVSGTLGLDGGALGSSVATSPLTILPGGVLNFNGTAVTINAPLTNNGTINWSSGNLTLANNGSSLTGVLYNQPGGLFNLLCDQALSYNVGLGLEFFSNGGTVRKSAGVGSTTISVTTVNTGLVDAQSGAIHFSGGGTIGGTYNTAFGDLISFDSGNYTVGTPTVTGTGLCQQSGATVTLNDRIPNFVLASGNVVLTPTFQGSGAIQNLQLDGATLIGTNRVSGTLGLDGGALGSSTSRAPLTVQPGGVLNFNGATVTINAPLTNNGTINWSSGNLTIANNGSSLTGVLYNQPGGLFNLLCDQSLSYSVGLGFEYFSNGGTVRKTAGRGTTTISLAFTNAGTLDVQSGIIQLASSYMQIGGTMNFGIISLGDYGQITFSGNAPLTGTLSVNFEDGYFPSAGDSFALVSYASHSGIFTNLALPSQAQWQTNYSGTTFTLSVLSASGLPVILKPVSLASGQFTMQLNAEVGPTYILLASTNLTSWTPLATNTPLAMPLILVDTNASKFPRRFYRAQVSP
jgi:hypothetical protein